MPRVYSAEDEGQFMVRYRNHNKKRTKNYHQYVRNLALAKNEVLYRYLLSIARRLKSYNKAREVENKQKYKPVSNSM